MGCQIGYPISDMSYIGPPNPISDIQYRIYPMSGFQTRYWVSNIRYWILDISNIRCWVFALCMRALSVCLYTYSLFHSSLWSMPSYIDTSHPFHGCGLWIWDYGYFRCWVSYPMSDIQYRVLNPDMGKSLSDSLYWQLYLRNNV
jgi:hypothetical protein